MANIIIIVVFIFHNVNIITSFICVYNIMCVNKKHDQLRNIYKYKINFNY